MTRYLCYTPEGYTEGPNGEECDNCQMLGYADGSNSDEAIENFWKDNPWVEVAGFSKDGIVAVKVCDE